MKYKVTLIMPVYVDVDVEAEDRYDAVDAAQGVFSERMNSGDKNFMLAVANNIGDMEDCFVVEI